MQMQFDEALRFEVDRILADPVLARAPVQSKLLRFLAAKSSAAVEARLTQFDIATKALGRSNDFDETTDSYVRTQISRLRITLANYYSRNEPTSEGCVFIKPGDYHLRLASREIAYPREPLAAKAPCPDTEAEAEAEAQAEAQGINTRLPPKTLGQPVSRFFARQSSRATFAMGAIFSFAMFFILAPSFLVDHSIQDQKEIGADRPFVAYNVEAVGFASNNSDLEELVSVANANVEELLAKSMTVYLHIEGANIEPGYNVRINFDLGENGATTADFFLLDRDGRTIYQGRRELPADIRAASSIIKEELVVITSPPGIIARHQASLIEGEPQSGFECFSLVEVGQANGRSISETLKSCLERYQESEYAPYLRARQLFWAFQKESITADRFDRSSPHWRQLSILLEEHPTNPYVNTLAAKVLLGDGECEQANPYIDKVFGQGNAFPALELMMATELSACHRDDTARTNWEHRTIEIFEANREPHALLELYEMTALLAYDHRELISHLPEKPFTEPDNSTIGHLITSLKSSVDTNRRFDRKDDIRAIIWNEQARDLITQRLRT